MGIKKRFWYQISEEIMNSEDRMFCGMIHSKYVTVAIGVLGFAFCLIAAIIYPTFKVYRSDNFWIPALALVYLFVFGCLILSEPLKSTRLMHPFLVVQVSVVGLTLMALIVFVLALSISWINGSSEFFEQRESSEMLGEPHPWQVSWAGLAMLAYIELCSLAIPLVLYRVGCLKEEEWNQRRRQMAERRQQQHQQQLTSSINGRHRPGSQQHLNNNNADGGEQLPPTATKLPLTAVYRSRILGGSGVEKGGQVAGSVKSVSFNVDHQNGHTNGVLHTRGAAETVYTAPGGASVVVIADDI